LGKLFTIKREGQKTNIQIPLPTNHFEKTRKEKEEFGLAETEKNVLCFISSLRKRKQSIMRLSNSQLNHNSHN